MKSPTVLVKDYDHLIYLIQSEIKQHGFHCSLNHLDVSQITSMHDLFASSNPENATFALFNGDISEWDVSNVVDFSWMFCDSQFNGNISRWNVSNAANMSGMFCHSSFNGDLSGWRPSKVIKISNLFDESHFSGDISGWRLPLAGTDKSLVNAKNFWIMHAFHSPHFRSDIRPLNLTPTQTETAFGRYHSHYFERLASIEEHAQLCSIYAEKPRITTRKTL